jgi:hypothetical protein
MWQRHETESEQIKADELVKTSQFYGIGRFITVFTTARHVYVPADSSPRGWPKVRYKVTHLTQLKPSGCTEPQATYHHQLAFIRMPRFSYTNPLTKPLRIQYVSTTFIFQDKKPCDNTTTREDARQPWRLSPAQISVLDWRMRTVCLRTSIQCVFECRVL